MKDARSNRFINSNIQGPISALCGRRPFFYYFRKITASITLVAFLATTVIQDFAWAAGTPLELTSVGSNRAGGPGSSSEASAKEDVFKELDPERFTLPQGLGTVKEAWSLDSSTPRRGQMSNKGLARGGYDSLPSVVIHIQDAHCNYSCQHKVADIIGYISKEYGVNMVNVEGGAKDYDLSLFTTISNIETRQKVADYFVSEGIINGAEYFGINNPEKVKLWGIEDTNLYIENLKIYRESLGRKENIEKYLNSISNSLDNLKTRIYSRELLELDSKCAGLISGSVELRDCINYLTIKAKDMSIDTEALVNIGMLGRTFQGEGAIDFKRANLEREELIDALQKKLSKNLLKELVAKTVDFKMEKLTQKEFYQYLLLKARAANINTGKIPELQKYANYVASYDSIDRTKIMDEVKSLENSVKARLFRNAKQRELDELSRNLAIIRNIFNISLTKKDYGYYRANMKAFKAARFVNFINREAPAYKMSATNGEEISGLDGYLEKMAEFYNYSLKRDDAFLRNLVVARSSAAPSGATKQSQNAAILITGGFHTENLCDLFKKNNIAYISIMPNFKNSEGYQCPYFPLLAGNGNNPVERKISALLSSVMAVASPFTALNDAVRESAGGSYGINELRLELEWAAARANGKQGIVVKYGGKVLGAVGEKDGPLITINDWNKMGEYGRKAFKITYITEIDPSLRLSAPDRPLFVNSAMRGNQVSPPPSGSSVLVSRSRETSWKALWYRTLLSVILTFIPGDKSTLINTAQYLLTPQVTSQETPKKTEKPIQPNAKKTAEEIENSTRKIIDIKLDREVEYKFYKLKDAPIYYIEFASMAIQDQALNQLRLFVESAKVAGKVLTYDEAYAKIKKREEYSGMGHDYTLKDICRFYTEAENKSVGLNIYAERIKNDLIAMGLIKYERDAYRPVSKENVAVISAAQDIESEFGKHTRGYTIQHEFRHAIYMTDPIVRESIKKMWDRIAPDQQTKIKNVVCVLGGFDGSNLDVVLTELYANLLDYDSPLAGLCGAPDGEYPLISIMQYIVDELGKIERERSARLYMDTIVENKELVESMKRSFEKRMSEIQRERRPQKVMPPASALPSAKPLRAGKAIPLSPEFVLLGIAGGIALTFFLFNYFGLPPFLDHILSNLFVADNAVGPVGTILAALPFIAKPIKSATVPSADERPPASLFGEKFNPASLKKGSGEYSLRVTRLGLYPRVRIYRSMNVVEDIVILSGKLAGDSYNLFVLENEYPGCIDRLAADPEMSQDAINEYREYRSAYDNLYAGREVNPVDILRGINPDRQNTSEWRAAVYFILTNLNPLISRVLGVSDLRRATFEYENTRSQPVLVIPDMGRSDGRNGFKDPTADYGSVLNLIGPSPRLGDMLDPYFEGIGLLMTTPEFMDHGILHLEFDGLTRQVGLEAAEFTALSELYAHSHDVDTGLESWSGATLDISRQIRIGEGSGHISDNVIRCGFLLSRINSESNRLSGDRLRNMILASGFMDNGSDRLTEALERIASGADLDQVAAIFEGADMVMLRDKSVPLEDKRRIAADMMARAASSLIEIAPYLQNDRINSYRNIVSRWGNDYYEASTRHDGAKMVEVALNVYSAFKMIEGFEKDIEILPGINFSNYHDTHLYSKVRYSMPVLEALLKTVPKEQSYYEKYDNIIRLFAAAYFSLFGMLPLCLIPQIAPTVIFMYISVPVILLFLDWYTSIRPDKEWVRKISDEDERLEIVYNELIKDAIKDGNRELLESLFLINSMWVVDLGLDVIAKTGIKSGGVSISEIASKNRDLLRLSIIHEARHIWQYYYADKAKLRISEGYPSFINVLEEEIDARKAEFYRAKGRMLFTLILETSFRVFANVIMTRLWKIWNIIKNIGRHVNEKPSVANQDAKTRSAQTEKEAEKNIPPLGKDGNVPAGGVDLVTLAEWCRTLDARKLLDIAEQGGGQQLDGIRENLRSRPEVLQEFERLLAAKRTEENPDVSSAGETAQSQVLKEKGFEDLGDGYFMKDDFVVHVSAAEGRESLNGVFVPPMDAKDRIASAAHTAAGEALSEEGLRNSGFKQTGPGIFEYTVPEGATFNKRNGSVGTHIKGDRYLVVFRDGKVIHTGRMAEYFAPRQNLVVADYAMKQPAGYDEPVQCLVLRDGPTEYAVNPDDFVQFVSHDPSVSVELPFSREQRVAKVSTLDGTETINGKPIAEIQEKATKKGSGHGTELLEPGESLADNHKRNSDLAASRGLTDTEMAEPLFYAINLVDHTLVSEYDPPLQYTYKGQTYQVEAAKYAGDYTSVFGDGLRVPITRYTVTNTRTGASVEFRTYDPYHITRYGVYGKAKAGDIIEVFFSGRAALPSPGTDGNVPAGMVELGEFDRACREDSAEQLINMVEAEGWGRLTEIQEKLESRPDVLLDFEQLLAWKQAEMAGLEVTSITTETVVSGSVSPQVKMIMINTYEWREASAKKNVIRQVLPKQINLARFYSATDEIRLMTGRRATLTEGGVGHIMLSCGRCIGLIVHNKKTGITHGAHYLNISNREAKTIGRACIDEAPADIDSMIGAMKAGEEDDWVAIVTGSEIQSGSSSSEIEQDMLNRELVVSALAKKGIRHIEQIFPGQIDVAVVVRFNRVTATHEDVFVIEPAADPLDPLAIDDYLARLRSDKSVSKDQTQSGDFLPPPGTDGNVPAGGMSLDDLARFCETASAADLLRYAEDGGWQQLDAIEKNLRSMPEKSLLFEQLLTWRQLESAGVKATEETTAPVETTELTVTTGTAIPAAAPSATAAKAEAAVTTTLPAQGSIIVNAAIPESDAAIMAGKFAGVETQLKHIVENPMNDTPLTEGHIANALKLISSGGIELSEENIDIITNDGNVLGPVNRTIAHLYFGADGAVRVQANRDGSEGRQLLHRIVNVFVRTPQNEIILMHRFNEKAENRIASVFSGHIMAKATPEDTVPRELMEEMGLPKGHVLSGVFERVEGVFGAARPRDSERRYVYIYNATEQDMVVMNKAIADLNQASRDEELHMVRLKEKQALGRGLGEIWDIQVVPADALLDMLDELNAGTSLRMLLGEERIASALRLSSARADEGVFPDGGQLSAPLPEMTAEEAAETLKTAVDDYGTKAGEYTGSSEDRRTLVEIARYRAETLKSYIRLMKALTVWLEKQGRGFGGYIYPLSGPDLIPRVAKTYSINSDPADAPNGEEKLLALLGDEAGSGLDELFKIFKDNDVDKSSNDRKMIEDAQSIPMAIEALEREFPGKPRTIILKGFALYLNSGYEQIFREKILPNLKPGDRVVIMRSSDFHIADFRQAGFVDIWPKADFNLKETMPISTKNDKGFRLPDVFAVLEYRPQAQAAPDEAVVVQTAPAPVDEKELFTQQVAAANAAAGDLVRDQNVVDIVITPRPGGTDHPEIIAMKAKIDRQIERFIRKECGPRMSMSIRSYPYTAEDIEVKFTDNIKGVLESVRAIKQEGAGKDPRAIIFAPDRIFRSDAKGNPITGYDIVKELVHTEFVDLAGMITIVKEAVPKDGLVNVAHHADLGKELLDYRRAEERVNPEEWLDQEAKARIVSHIVTLVQPGTIPANQPPDVILNDILHNGLCLQVMTSVNWNNWAKSQEQYLALRTSA